MVYKRFCAFFECEQLNFNQNSQANRGGILQHSPKKERFKEGFQYANT
ncbi:hypothetical protein HMPREF1448_00576 [Helicobacter pylori HP260AFi]|uniref:Uncharacterized protein n=1 Tax=Helicobacter pylori HP260AFii TaxID=1159077 RepID=A0ABC9SB63_HELPX